MNCLTHWGRESIPFWQMRKPKFWLEKWLAPGHPTENLIQNPHYPIVTLGTLPSPVPILVPKLPSKLFFQRRLTALVHGCLWGLLGCRCWSTAGYHATPHAGSCSGVGAKKHLRSLWKAEQEEPSSRSEPSSSSQCPAAWEAWLSQLNNAQLLLWPEPGCLPAWDQLLQILFGFYPSQCI